MKTSSLILLFLIALCFTSCTEQRTNYIILLDNSNSIPNDLWNKYLSVIEKTVLHNLCNKDKLTIEFIDECSMTKAQRIYTLDLSQINFSNLSDGQIAKDDSVKVRLTRFLDDSIAPALKDSLYEERAQRKVCANYTDILNAIHESTSLLMPNKNFSSSFNEVTNSAVGKHNYIYTNSIIIFSDMVNEDAEHKYDFTRMATVPNNDIDKKVEELHDFQAIPNLTGVQVFVYGATASQTGIHADQQIENIQYFWQQYFKNAGAELKAYGYDTQNELQEYVSSDSQQ